MNKKEKEDFSVVVNKLNRIEYKIQGAALLFGILCITILFKLYV